MGMSVAAAGRKSGGGRRGVPRYGAMAEINMTPFIDVMLVLLIIFMVAAPLLATGVPIDLPQTKAAALNIDQKPLAVAIDDKGAIFLMDQPVEVDRLARQAAGARQGRLRRAHLCARLQGRELRPRRRNHVAHHRRRLQEGRAGDRAGEEVRRPP